MVALIFLLVIAVVFAAVFALESGAEHFERRPAGLLTWIASGNWPAKIGGGLMIVGIGALLRIQPGRGGQPYAGKPPELDRQFSACWSDGQRRQRSDHRQRQ